MAIVGVHRHAVRRLLGGLLVGSVFLTGCLHDEGKPPRTLVQYECSDDTMLFEATDYFYWSDGSKTSSTRKGLCPDSMSGRFTR